ncbi:MULTISPECIES: YdcF family protein [Lactobacillus]|uniref:YdcF family protein n=1 Tax=Lactobacillus xujianguonis TaxID=2495899 RepID=A0A437SXA5_9LACO|nr:MULTISPECIES: YdcF family protein [Lactobacillus]RVU71447.1 YdcF family protein [Lactobacillus xujianguonis]RVU72440.1 YdcF family protein [Lactobacillus xujianguonis]
MTTFLHFFENNREFTYFSILLTLALIIWLVCWLKEPRRLINGILFTVFILLLAIWFTIMVFSTHLKTLMSFYGFLVLAIMLLILLIAAFSWVFLFWNAYFVWKYESHTLPNLLTLILGIGIIIAWVIAIWDPSHYLPEWVKLILTSAPAIAIYLLFIMYNFLVNLILYQFVPRRYNQDYLIVLGAGLLKGRTVTPLLAGRINRAIQFAHKQVAKGRKMPKFIMSGGQGGDEKVAEAQAMAEYAMSRGIDPKQILLEKESKNTYQNMVYSKKIAIKDFGSENFKAKFFSNNYHIFRAGLFAKMAGLNANGVGCYTRFYFLPNAVIREFAGVFVMHKKRHFIVMGLIILFFVIQAFLQLIGLERFMLF